MPSGGARILASRVVRQLRRGGPGRGEGLTRARSRLQKSRRFWGV